MCKYELSMSRLSKVIVLHTEIQTDRQTDRQTRPKLYTTPLRGWWLNMRAVCHIKYQSEMGAMSTFFIRAR